MLILQLKQEEKFSKFTQLWGGEIIERFNYNPHKVVSKLVKIEITVKGGREINEGWKLLFEVQ